MRLVLFFRRRAREFPHWTETPASSLPEQLEKEDPSMKVPTVAIVAFVLAVVGGASLIPAGGARADALPTAREGTLLCGGNYNGSGTNQVSWVLRNYDDARKIVVDRIRLYDSESTVLFDSLGSGLPPSRFLHLGPADNELAPHETAHYRSDELVPAAIFPNVPLSRRPFQFIVNWSAEAKGLALNGSMVRRRFDSGVEVGRHQYDCRQGGK
jgi:hypothetical protein